MQVLATVVRFIEQSLDNKFLAGDVVRALRVIARFLRAMQRSDQLDEMLEELAFLNFWPAFRHLFLREFGREPELTAKLASILALVPMGAADDFARQFFADHRDVFALVLRQTRERNPLVLAGFKFSALANFCVAVPPMLGEFYRDGFFGEILRLLDAGEGLPTGLLMCLHTFFKLGLHSDIDEFLEREAGFFEVLFGLMGRGGILAKDFVCVLEVLKKSFDFSASPDELLEHLKSHEEFVRALEVANSEHQNYVEDLELQVMIETLLK